MPNIVLQSSDGENFKVDVEVVKCSEMLKTMLANLGIDEEEEEIVPLPKYNSDILKKVIEWCTHHKDDPPQSEFDNKRQTYDVPTWDAEFLKVDQGTLFKLLLAAHFLDIKGLYDLTCTTVANRLKCKTAEQIRQEFNIENDYTAMEEEQL